MTPGVDCCMFCEMPVPRGEKHHFPVPKRHGGDDTVVVCVNCHDLADRTALPLEAMKAFNDLWQKAAPFERIVLWRMHALHLDALAHLKRSDAK